MSHTPGPWIVSSSCLVCTDEGKVLASTVPMIGIESLSVPLRDCEANARLIAAVPELLEVALLVVNGMLDQEALRREALEAISKATGAT